MVEHFLDGVLLGRAGVPDLDAAAARGDVGGDDERRRDLGLLEAGQAEGRAPLGVRAVAGRGGRELSLGVGGRCQPAQAPGSGLRPLP